MSKMVLAKLNQKRSVQYIKKKSIIVRNFFTRSYRVFLWVAWELVPVRFIWEKVFPPKGGYKENRKPCTIGAWVITIYIACYGFASQRYEGRLERAEFKYNAFTTQIGANARFNYTQLLKIGKIELPVRPEILAPSTVLDSLCFPIAFQTYANNEDIENSRKTMKPWSGASILASFYCLIKKEGCKDDQTNPQIESKSFYVTVVEEWRDKLSYAELGNANLMEASLKKANLLGAELWKANLRKADLWKADLRSSTISYGNLSEASLSSADLRKAVLRNASLINTSLLNADLTDAILSRADLRNSSFRGASLNDADMSGANLGGADFSKTSLNGGDLSWANLSGTKFEAADLSSANLRGAIFDKSDPVDILVKAETLYQATLPPDIEAEIREKGYGHLLDVAPNAPAAF